MAGRLAGKRCLIVGGTTGIGFSAAKRFIAEGAALVIAGRSDEKGKSASESLGVPFFACDASDEADVDRLFEQVVRTLGGLDALYHVAGISGRRHGDGPLHECTAAGWDATLAANLRSVFLANRSAVRMFLAQGAGGVVLNMASVLAFAPSPSYFDTAAYAASKGGIISLSVEAAARYAREKIRINVIAPSLIDTPMSQRAARDPAIRTFLETKQPLSRGPGRPEDCDGAAVFLCSDDSSFVTGTVLTVDGGWRLSDGQLPIPGRV